MRCHQVCCLGHGIARRRQRKTCSEHQLKVEFSGIQLLSGAERAFFQKSPKQRPEHSPLCEEEILFSFRKGTGGKSISGVSLKFDSGAGRKFKLTSSAGYSACLKSDEEGCISINNIPDGEYILTAAAEAQSETHS